jgi:hypothetical protein
MREKEEKDLRVVDHLIRRRSVVGFEKMLFLEERIICSVMRCRSVIRWHILTTRFWGKRQVERDRQRKETRGNAHRVGAKERVLVVAIKACVDPSTQALRLDEKKAWQIVAVKCALAMTH